jgi:hypothetical protein
MEALGSPSQAQDSEHESIAVASATQDSEHESLQVVIQSRTSRHEALGGISRERASQHESVGQVEQTQDSEHESLQPVSQTGVSQHESLQPVSQTGQSEHEALAELEQTQKTEYESLQEAGAVSQTQVTWFESIGGVNQAQDTEYESIAEAEASQPSAHESLQGVSLDVAASFESLQGVDAEEASQQEAIGRVSGTQDSEHESIGQASHFEALGEVTQVQVTVYEAAGTVLADPTELDLEMVPAAFDMIDEVGMDVTFQAAGGPVVVRVSPPLKHLQRFVRRTSVRHGSMQLIVPAQGLTFTPAKDMLVSVMGVDGRILEVDPVPSGNRIAIYVVFVEMGGQEFTPSSRETTLDAEMVPVILDILTTIGITVTVLENAVTSYDPLTDAEVVAAEVEHSVLSTPPDKFEDAYVDGTVIRESDMQVFIKAADLTFRPREGRALTFVETARRWKVVTFAMVPTGEQVGLWDLQLRR